MRAACIDMFADQLDDRPPHSRACEMIEESLGIARMHFKSFQATGSARDAEETRRHLWRAENYIQMVLCLGVISKREANAFNDAITGIEF